MWKNALDKAITGGFTEFIFKGYLIFRFWLACQELKGLPMREVNKKVHEIFS